VLDAANDTTFMAACTQHGWTRLKPDGTDLFIQYGAAFIEAQLALGANGALAPLEGRRRRKPKRARHQRCAESRLPSEPAPPPLAHCRSSVVRGARRSACPWAVLAALSVLVALVVAWLYASPSLW
jgi:hypothetical protein